MRPEPFGSGNHYHDRAAQDGVEASMRPEPFGSGNLILPCRTTTTICASMRPEPFGSGNLPRLPVPGSHHHASMRPEPFGSGNSPPRSCRQRSGGSRFNEAGAFRLRKLRRVRGGEARLVASMRPEPFGSGNSGGTEPTRRGIPASMRPEPFGSGNGRPLPIPTKESTRFNEAGAFRLRKSRAPRGTGTASRALQ